MGSSILHPLCPCQGPVVGQLVVLSLLWSVVEQSLANLRVALGFHSEPAIGPSLQIN